MDAIYDVAVVGGGASGMAAALAAAREGARTIVLERQERVGRKLAATGNGRCNLTNLAPHPEAHYHGGALPLTARAMALYPPRKVAAFFESVGVRVVEEAEGRAYPASDQASSVVDALRLSLAEAGAEIRCGFAVERVERSARFILIAPDGRQVLAWRVIFATGGLAAPKLGADASGHKLLAKLGHPASRCLPALSPLRTEPERVRALKGVKYTGGIALLVRGEPVRAERGEVLFTEYGVSGIAAMQLARTAAEAIAAGQKPQVRLSPFEGKCAEALSMLTARQKALSARALDEFLTGYVSKRLGQTLVRLAAPELPMTAPAASLTGGQLRSLAELLSGWTLPLTGVAGFEAAQVTAGGVGADGIGPDDLQSTRVPGLYVTGEALDVDGDCGGYNLQWAWASGLLAGTHAARAVTKQA